MPSHVAIIMDGNNRWARARGLSGARGHRAGVEAVRAVIERAAERGVGTLSLFAFSSENWKRPAAEVNALMELFLMALKREVKKLHERNIRLSIIGEQRGFSHAIQKHIQRAQALTADNTGMHLVIAANYGGQWDITRAARQLAEQVAAGELSPDAIDEARMDAAMGVEQVPPVDLCIRTSGEQRLSNFLLWQLAYAELHFSPLLWPDFNGAAFDKAVDDFCLRRRRFGMTDEQIEAQGA
ncbi:ditrans,polycis-undecaprenyl-diphosphate synthase ((2E,6E)-farnesyl-diphosphate specific) [Vreelandella hamiltonii]|uniref:Ditrans,polycis-undecaprenyl-diphosphate synthase ((2E,6E)-farnesyl-diphosphate specific) n=3 Tax=Oceanospirillales TaxID=135619 RepID=A0A8H9IN54_9GAMM|nr:ditrans,polycis-undecaprenyl-diphosphate synthase ((2E,6E)-farnesyl-diphosphate specific) [Halomonas johnsoniae]GHD54905.1 ditrans,polycis-undecaprenyl-diphosphate synthase ((2E,6E)-farnesyl-diphosphate specific) [Halomonas hamiltonii]